jgi:1A family penicillin-binding protein
MLKVNKKFFFPKLFNYAMGVFIVLMVVTTTWFFSLLHNLPDPKNLAYKLQLPSIQIQDRNGLLLYEDLGKEAIRHRPVKYEDLPECLINATVATEDHTFFTNPGFDLKAMLRAIWINIRGGQILAGGSTITQQVVRNLLMSDEERSHRTLHRKIREIILAWQLSRHLSKQEILSLYLNQTYYGSFAYGVEAAAQTYFGKSITELTLAECTLIAGLPQSPAHYNPFIYPENAKQRQEIVLERLFDRGYISAEEKQQAQDQPLIFTEQPYPLEAPHFVMLIRNTIDQMEKEGLIPSEARKNGMIIRTTLDLNWQRLAEKAIQHHLQRLSQGRDGLGHNVKNAALVAINPTSGAVLAMVGSPDYYNQAIYGAINMAIVPRQPGSALKPFIYALAMDPNASNPLTAATQIDDTRTVFFTRDHKAYIPVNYDGKEHGKVTVREALASSLNIPAVSILNQVGLERFAAFMKTLGIQSLDSPDRYDLTIALGGGGVRLLELTAAYGVFANKGVITSPYWIESISDNKGNVYYQASQKSKKVMDERVAWLISDILSDDQARYIGFGQNSILNLDRPVAVKTGTTTDFHDNWTIGYTPSLVVGVWVGNADYEPMVEVTGLTGAAPIWHEFLRAVMINRPVEQFERPDGLIQQTICKKIHPANQQCLEATTEWFITGTQPDLNTLSTHASQINTQKAHFSILSPRPNGIYLLPTYSSPKYPKLLIELRNNTSLTQFKIFIDGVLLASLETEPLITWWQMQEGRHVLRIEGWQGNQLIEEQKVTFTVQPPLR